TPDLIDLLCQIGNKNSNAVWEGRMDPGLKPDPRASREVRLKFITQKYVNRGFVPPLSPTLSVHASSNDLLLDSVKHNDLQAALHGLALRADPNLIDPETNMHITILSLISAEPLSASVSNTSEAELSPSSTASIKPPTPATFPLAELLLQNGAEIPGDEP